MEVSPESEVRSSARTNFNDYQPPAPTRSYSIDIPGASPSSTLQTSISSSPAPGTSAAAAPNTDAQAPKAVDTPSNGLSTGAQAGIGVGIAVMIIALLAGWYVARRRSRKDKRQTKKEQEEFEKAELEGGLAVKKDPGAELDPTNELKLDKGRAELLGDKVERGQDRTELEGDDKYLENPMKRWEGYDEDGADRDPVELPAGDGWEVPRPEKDVKDTKDDDRGDDEQRKKS